MSAAQLFPHLLEQAMLIPAAAFCFISMWQWFKRPMVAVGRAAALVAALMLAGAVISRRTGRGDICLLVGMGVCFIVLALSVDAPLGKAAFCFANAAMLCYFCVMYITLLMAPVELGNPGDTFLPVTSLTCLGLAALVGAVFWRTLRVKLPRLMEEHRMDGLWRRLWLLPAGMMLFFRWATPISAAVVMTGRVRQEGLSIFVFFPGFALLLYHLLWRTTVRLADSARLEQENRILQAESQRYRELNEYMNATRQLRHDFRQHLHVISRLAGTRQYDRLNEYLARFGDNVEEAHPRLCANPAVDAIAAHYASRARGAGIEAQFVIDLPEHLPVSETDYCVLLGNLLENAFNAVEALPEDQRRVSVVSRMLTDAMLGLSVENPYRGALELDDAGRPVAARPGHGVGLLSASAVVNQYRGSMDINTQGGVFSVSILLYL